MIELVTSTGAKYHIDLENQFWRKTSRDGHVGYWDRLWGYKRSPEFPKGFPWEADTGWESELPEVGQHLYITSRDQWWISTPIVEVNEIEGGIDES